MRLLNVGRRGIIRAALVTAGVLLIPLWGSVFVEGWNWDWKGFLVVGAFVFTAALTYQTVARTISNRAYRIAVGLAVMTTFVLIWTNFVLAIDVNTANFLFLGVVPVGVVGAAIARLQARGMALALCGMTIAQLLVPVVALVFWKTGVALGAVPVIGLNGVYTVLFAMSALLFRRAARTHEMQPTRLE